MKISIKKLLLLALVVVMAIPAVAKGDKNELPLDPSIRVGKLKNGLTYYIRSNKKPENIVNFYIAQKVGSIQEEESQRGLAHFL
jgi:zinc protease